MTFIRAAYAEGDTPAEAIRKQRILACGEDLLAVVQEHFPTIQRNYLTLAARYAGTSNESDPVFVSATAMYERARAVLAKATGTAA